MSSPALPSDLVALGTELRAYLRIMGAMIRREFQSRLGAPLSSTVDLLEPVLLIGVTTSAWWLLDRRSLSPLGGSPILFYTAGFFFVYLFIHQSARMRRSVDAPDRRFPVERRLDAIFIHILFKLFEYGVLGLLLFGGIALFITDQAIPYNWVAVIEALIAVTMLGFGWGMLNIVMVKASRLWSALYQPLNRSFVIFSGVVFIVDFISPAARYVLSFVPLVHALSLFRLGFFPNQPTFVLDREYLAFCAVFSVAMGLVIERLSRRSE